VERYELGRKAAPDLFQMMMKAQKKSALMGCSIDADDGQMEAQLSNGLIIGHAYSVTDVRQIEVQTSRAAGKIPMVRVRNPWGDSHEWKGAWSDGSQEWSAVPQEEKRQLGLTFDHDGEFWMSFKDFVSNFQRLEICFLGPESLDNEARAGKTTWEAGLFEGGWRRRVNAGGCRNYPATFWTNPQYRVTVVDPDSDDEDGNGTLLIGLMQKERRKLKKEGKSDLTIGYAVYRAPDGNNAPLDNKFFSRNTASARSTAFINLREVSDHHKLSPGNYVVVPSTFEPNEEGEFILRVYSETKRNRASELDDVTGIADVNPAERFGGPTPEEEETKDAGKKAFIEMAGADGEVDAFELQKILNTIFTREFAFDGFTTDVTRSMVAMRDADFSGKLGFEDFKTLWADLTICKKAFKEMDTDKSGNFSSYELRTAFAMLGFHVSNATFHAIVIRYSDKDGLVRFNDFVACYIKLKTLFDGFRGRDTTGMGRAKFALDEFTMKAMYS